MASGGWSPGTRRLSAEPRRMPCRRRYLAAAAPASTGPNRTRSHEGQEDIASKFSVSRRRAPCFACDKDARAGARWTSLVSRQITGKRLNCDARAASQSTPLFQHGGLCNLMCEELHMATNLSVDPDLIEEALKVSGERTKAAAVTKALQEFIARRKQKRVLDLVGKLEWNPEYDYKKERSRR